MSCRWAFDFLPVSVGEAGHSVAGSPGQSAAAAATAEDPEGKAGSPLESAGHKFHQRREFCLRILPITGNNV